MLRLHAKGEGGKGAEGPSAATMCIYASAFETVGGRLLEPALLGGLPQAVSTGGPYGWQLGFHLQQPSQIWSPPSLNAPLLDRRYKCRHHLRPLSREGQGSG